MSRTVMCLLFSAALGLLVGPTEARAGMPSFTLTDLARMRIDTISFFLLGFLASARVIQGVWNSFRDDFPRLPRLTYGRAVGAVMLWGLLFLLVLTMISGARELMTPGAWKKEGATYKLRDSPAAAPVLEAPEGGQTARRQALDRLRIALWTYARGHGGRFPADDAPGAVPDEAWLVPDPSGLRYLYRGGQALGEGTAPLAFEPGVFDGGRLVLLTSGAIRRVSEEELRRILESATRALR